MDGSQMSKRDMLQSMSKDALVQVARSHGWKGDDARTTKGELIEWCDAEVPVGYLQGFTSNAPLQATIAPAPTPAQPAQSADAAAAAVAALQALMGATQPKVTLDPETIRAIVAEEVGKLAPRTVTIRTPDGEWTPPAGVYVHPAMPKVLALVRAGLNVMLVGPAGSGKTSIAHHVADALGRSFSSVSCSAGMSESQLSGWLLPGEGGSFNYRPAPFVTSYENGGVFLFDEIDAADSNTLVFLNSATANGSMFIPQRTDAPEIKRHANNVLMAAANTFGHGADAQYVGRNQLDAATLDRWYVVRVGYIDELERALAGLTYQQSALWECAAEPTAQELRSLGEWVLSLRERVATAKLRRVVSTRMLQRVITARRAGVPAVECKADALAGWTRDELAKVGEQA